MSTSRPDGENPRGSRSDGGGSAHEESLFFIEPDGSNREAVRRLGYRIVDLIVDSGSRALERAPLDRETLPLGARYEPSEDGRPVEELFPEIERCLRHGMNPSHPGYLGHMDTIASAIGVFSDAVVSSLNNNMLAFEMSPIFTELERRLMQWAASLFGLGSARPGESTATPTGHLVSGGTLANVTALLVARNAKGGDERLRAGLAANAESLCFVASENAHYSFQKAANFLGLGRDGWIRTPVDHLGRARVDGMAEAIAEARRAGKKPFALVAVAGTTVTGSIDPLRELAALARREGLWFHVDAAYGGAVALSPRLRPLLDGIELADSVTFNPQKWLFVPKTCASILFRDARDVETYLREGFHYGNSNRNASGQSTVNLGEYTLQGTRRVDALKLYLTLEHLGRRRLAQWIEGHLELGRYFARRIAASGPLRLVQEPDLNIVCFRLKDEPTSPREVAQLDEWHRSIHEALERGGDAWLSLPQYQGRKALRAVILHPRTDEARLDRVLECVLSAERNLRAAT